MAAITTKARLGETFAVLFTIICNIGASSVILRRFIKKEEFFMRINLVFIIFLIMSTICLANEQTNEIDTFTVWYVPGAIQYSSQVTQEKAEERTVNYLKMSSQNLNKLFFEINAPQTTALEKLTPTHLISRIANNRTNRTVCISSKRHILSEGKRFIIDAHLINDVIEDIIRFSPQVECEAGHFTIFYIPTDGIVDFYSLTTPQNIEKRAFCTFDISSCHLKTLFREIEESQMEPVKQRRYEEMRIKIIDNYTNEIIYISINRRIFFQGKQSLVNKQLVNDVVEEIVQFSNCIWCEPEFPKIEGTPIPFER